MTTWIIVISLIVFTVSCLVLAVCVALIVAEEE